MLPRSTSRPAKIVVLSLSTIVLASVFTVSATHANTLRWASSGDSLTLDPHAQNELSLIHI